MLLMMKLHGRSICGSTPLKLLLTMEVVVSHPRGGARDPCEPCMLMLHNAWLLGRSWGSAGTLMTISLLRLSPLSFSGLYLDLLRSDCQLVILLHYIIALLLQHVCILYFWPEVQVAE